VEGAMCPLPDPTVGEGSVEGHSPLPSSLPIREGAPPPKPTLLSPPFTNPGSALALKYS